LSVFILTIEEQKHSF